MELYFRLSLTYYHIIRHQTVLEEAMTPLEITLIILLATLVAFMTGKIPFSVIASGIILALIMTGVMTPAEAFSGFINTNVVMFVAMFVIGAGLTKTSLIDKAQNLVVRYKDNPRMLIFLSCLAASFLGAVTSATATAAIMIPLLVGIANDIGTSRSKLLYPAMACANIATSMTFLGQGASNMTWNDVMLKAGATKTLHVWAIAYMVFVGYKLMPDIDNNSFSDHVHQNTADSKLSPLKEKIAMVIILGSIGLMLLENVIGVDMYLIACIGAVLLVLTGVLSEKEALESMHMPTIFLFAGVLALSDAIKVTGAGEVVADLMIKIIGNNTNTYVIMAVFFMIPFILTQVMSNLATLTIFIPLVTSACIKIGVDPRAAVVGVLTASCISIMTPMAAPCQIMIIEPGGYKLKDYLKCGTPLAIILAIMTIFLMPLMFPMQ